MNRSKRFSTRGTALRKFARAFFALSIACFIDHDAIAFPHVVTPGETLASIAERNYGKVEMERLLVSANALDASGGIAIVPGMRLEIPANSYHRVASGETWASLATHYLGDPDRADVLALSNDAMPWIEPVLGQELRIPYNLRHVASSNDSTLAIAYKYTGDRDKAWMIDKYNRLKGRAIHRGDVILVPLWELGLTEAGKNEAIESFVVSRSEGGGRGRDAQKRADGELVTLFSDVRQGRYVDAIAKGNHILGLGDLTKPQVAAANRLLTEAYVALDAKGPAEAACSAWRDADPEVVFDPTFLSPKIIRACTASLSIAKEPRIAPKVDGGIDAGAQGDAGNTDRKGTRP